MASRARYTLWSRETALLVNNILLVIAMAVVLLGTLYPLAYEAFTGGDKISVGVPYFNAGFVPLMLALTAALGIAPVLQWKRTAGTRLWQDLRWPLLISVVAGLLLPLVVSGALSWQVVVAVSLGIWVVTSHLRDLMFRARRGLGRVTLGYWGMLTAHMGFAVALFGIALTSVLSVEMDLRMSPGDRDSLGEMSVTFEGIGSRSGVNFVAQRGTFRIDDGGEVLFLYPEKRRYLVRNSVMTEAAIDAGFFRDIYVSLGEPLDNGDWAVRLQLKPFVRWIWLGGLLMALGGVVAVSDARYRRLRSRVTAGGPVADAV
jgi:cytochrome c-type biogenesis protein CcmF